MSNLISDLEFNKNDPSLKIDNNLLSKLINESSVFLNKSNSKKTIHLTSKKIRSGCSNIFYNLVKQSQDQDFIFFLNELAKKIDKYIEDLTEHTLSLDEALKKNKSKLSENRHYFGKLNEKLIDEILNQSKGHLKRFRENIKNNKMSRNDLSVNTGSDIKIIAKKINSEFKKLGILTDVSNYMKKNYEVTGVALEMSTPNSTWWKKKEIKKKIPKTLYAHLDESPIYPKSICYLTNVSEDNGPTSFYPNIWRRKGRINCVYL
jgi:predicted transcriptional regulator